MHFSQILAYFFYFELILTILPLNTSEDPVNSTPDVSYFLRFSGPPVRDTMCNMVIFFENFGVRFYTIKTRTLISEIDFLNLFPIFFFKKTNFCGLCPGLNCVKMDTTIFKKKNAHVAHSIPDGRPRKK